MLTLVRLARPTAHAIKWRPMAAGAVLGLVVLLVPEALVERLTDAQLTSLARIAALGGALGAAFLLDDPSSRSTRTVPTSRLARHVVRVALAGPAVALWWILMLVAARRGAHLPAAALTLEAASMLAVALAVSAVAQRRSADGNTSVVAAPAVLLFVAVAWALPQPVELIVRPADPGWTASHHRWAVVLVAALVAFLWAGHERA